MNPEPVAAKQCCAAFYSSDLARLLLGDSFHPGGVALTTRLAELLQLSPQSHLLDVASGRGTSAFHLAETTGCRVTGIDLSPDNVAVATAEAERRGLAQLVQFQTADAETLPFDEQAFDAIVCECAFCTFPSKAAAAREFVRVLRPGGQLALSDLTRSAALPPALEGLLAWVACIGDALPLQQYVAVFESAGLQIRATEDHSAALLEMARQIQTRLLGAEIMVGLKKLNLPGVDFAAAKDFLRAAFDAIRQGDPGYAVLLAQRP